MGDVDDASKLLTAHLTDDEIGKPVDILPSHCWEANFPSGNTGLHFRRCFAHRNLDRGERMHAHFVERQ
jgi:hypothetical protein